jgi:signal transduction histidine kinase
MKVQKLQAQIEQLQAELSGLLNQVWRLSASNREEIVPVLEKIYTQLGDLDSGILSDEPEESQIASLAGSPVAVYTQNAEGPPWEKSWEAIAATLHDGLPIVYYVWDLKTDRWRLSNGLVRFTGSNFVPDRYHFGWLKNIRIEDRNRIEPVLTRIKLERLGKVSRTNQTTSYEFEYHLQHADNFVVRVWDRAIIERDLMGLPVRAIGVLEDITTLHAMQKSLLLSYKAMAQSNIALRKQKEQIHNVLANVPVAFFQTDSDLRYSWIYSPIMDESTDQFIGKRDDEILPGETANELMKMKQDALRYHTRMQKEMVISMDGLEREVFVSVQPIFSEEQACCGTVGTLVDLTRQRNLESLVTEKAFKLELNRRLLDQSEQEHQHIGRMIQDGPIQDLSAMGFAVQLARQLFPQPESLQVMEQLKDEIKEMVVELRKISNELRPPGLTRFGLSHALQSYTEEFQLRNPGIKINLALTDSGAGLSDQAIQALFNIVNESFLNIIHHAQASEVTVSLNIQPKVIHMEIQDNGHGFEGQPDWMGLTSQGRYGMTRMKESAEAIGGTLKVRSDIRQGTVVVAEVPLAG